MTQRFDVLAQITGLVQGPAQTLLWRTGITGGAAHPLFSRVDFLLYVVNRSLDAAFSLFGKVEQPACDHLPALGNSVLNALVAHGVSGRL